MKRNSGNEVTAEKWWNSYSGSYLGLKGLDRDVKFFFEKKKPADA